MHNMGLKRPVFISYVISVMDECFFAESLKYMFFYNVLFHIVFKYGLPRIILFIFPSLLYKQTQFLCCYINFTHMGQK